MPKYYCDYCDTYLTHDSPSVRKTHCNGRKHKENVRLYYQKWLEEQVQKLVDDTTAAFKAGSGKSSSSTPSTQAPPVNTGPAPGGPMPPGMPLMGHGPGGPMPPMMQVGMRPPMGMGPAMGPMGMMGPMPGMRPPLMPGPPPAKLMKKN